LAYKSPWRLKRVEGFTVPINYDRGERDNEWSLAFNQNVFQFAGGEKCEFFKKKIKLKDSARAGG